MRDYGRGSACGGSDKGKGVASGEDADVAERAEWDQIAIAGDDEDGLCAEAGVNERRTSRRASFIRCRNSNHGPRLAPCVMSDRNNSGFLW